MTFMSYLLKMVTDDSDDDLHVKHMSKRGGLTGSHVLNHQRVTPLMGTFLGTQIPLVHQNFPSSSAMLYGGIRFCVIYPLVN